MKKKSTKTATARKSSSKGSSTKAKTKKLTNSKSLIEKYKSHKTDTGSTTVQILTLSDRIRELTEHLKGHKKDRDSRVGLLKMVNKRRSLLDYLRRNDEQQYKSIISDIGLKK